MHRFQNNTACLVRDEICIKYIFCVTSGLRSPFGDERGHCFKRKKTGLKLSVKDSLVLSRASVTFENEPRLSVDVTSSCRQQQTLGAIFCHLPPSAGLSSCQQHRRIMANCKHLLRSLLSRLLFTVCTLILLAGPSDQGLDPWSSFMLKLGLGPGAFPTLDHSRHAEAAASLSQAAESAAGDAVDAADSELADAVNIGF